MSTLVLDVLPWFAGFFFLDALAHLRRGQVMFTRSAWGRVQPLRLGMRLVGVAPFGISVVAYELPFVATAKGLWLFDPAVQGTPPVVEAEQLSFVPWDALGAIEASGSTIRARSRVVFRARSVRDARRLASTLTKLARLAPEERAEALQRQSEQAFDVNAVRERWRRVRIPARIAGALGTIETLLLFGALPIVALTPGVDETDWARVLGALVLVHVLAVCAAGWTFARWGLSAGERGGALFQMLLLPVYAARAGVQSLREAFSDFEPLAISAVLLAPDDFVRAARRELVRIETSRDRASDPELAGSFEARLQCVDRVLAATGLDREQVLATPADRIGGEPFCPLCLCEHRTGFATCADCTIPLVQRPPGPDAEPSEVQGLQGVARLVTKPPPASR